MAIEKLNEVGEDVIFGQVADGHTIGTLAKTYAVSRRTFYNWINAEPGRRKRLNEAKALAAEALVEECDKIADDANPVTYQVAALRIKQKLFKAGKLDPETWGEKPAQVNVGVSLGDLHINALRRAQMPVLKSEDVKELTSGDEN